jgi:hypothetical protein
MNGANKLITLDLPLDEAHALAQLVKRLDRSDCERLSNRYDSGQERDAMIAGVDNLQRALAEAGFAPLRCLCGTHTLLVVSATAFERAVSVVPQ